MLRIYAVVAEKERSLISQRTKAALAAVKARGWTLGNPRLPRRSRRGSKLKAEADAFAANVRPILDSSVHSATPWRVSQRSPRRDRKRRPMERNDRRGGC